MTNRSDTDYEQSAFEAMCELHPHEAHRCWPDRFMDYAMRKTGLGRDEIERLLKETEGLK